MLNQLLILVRESFKFRQLVICGPGPLLHLEVRVWDVFTKNISRGS